MWASQLLYSSGEKKTPVIIKKMKKIYSMGSIYLDLCHVNNTLNILLVSILFNLRGLFLRQKPGGGRWELREL